MTAPTLTAPAEQQDDLEQVTAQAVADLYQALAHIQSLPARYPYNARPGRKVTVPGSRSPVTAPTGAPSLAVTPASNPPTPVTPVTGDHTSPEQRKHGFTR